MTDKRNDVSDESDSLPKLVSFTTAREMGLPDVAHEFEPRMPDWMVNAALLQNIWVRPPYLPQDGLPLGTWLNHGTWAITPDRTTWYTNLKVKRVDAGAVLPTRGSDQAIGLDLYANEEACIVPGDRACIKTGIAVDLPPGHYGRIAPRSGLAARSGIDVLAGVIDQDYRGEISVVLHNTWTHHAESRGWGEDQSFFVERGQRIAQLILERATIAHVVEVDEFEEETARGGNGFGSTGI